MPARFRPRRTPLLAVVLVGVPVGLLVSCGDDGGGGDGEAFCARVAEDQQLLFATPLDTPQSVDDLLAAMRDAGEVAPLAIESEWDELTGMFDAVANGSLPYDDDDIAPIYMSERSALTIQEWLAANCGVDIAVGRVPDPLPQASVPVASAAATTIAATATGG